MNGEGGRMKDEKAKSALMDGSSFIIHVSAFQIGSFGE